MSPLALSLHFLQAQPDGRLVALAREGHAPAFEALVRRYRRELLAYCRRMQPRSGIAEDALQQTFLQAWKALNAGAEIRDVRAWLYRIAHNVTLNQLRTAGSIPQDMSEAAGGQELHQLVEQRLQARAALAGVASLPELQRQVFVSTTLDGASHDEVASALGLSSGAVRGLVYRARATLRSAAAALTPSPALQWVLRRAETRVGGARTVGEVLAGGSGAGVTAAIVKGGAVLTLAGAVVGTGGAILTHGKNHPRRSETRSALVRSPSPAAKLRQAVAALGSEFVPAIAVKSTGNSHLIRSPERAASGRPSESGLDEVHRGVGVDPTGAGRNGSDGGAFTSSSASSEVALAEGATVANSSDGGSEPSSGGSSGSDGGASGSPSTSTSTTSGSNGGTSAIDGSSDGTQVTTTQTTSGGSSGSDGGTGTSSGSDGTTTTPSN